MIIGIDLGGMSAKAACLADGKLKEIVRVETSARAPYEETAGSLADLAIEAARAAGVGLGEIEAVGIGSPGVIDSETGTVVLWSNFFWEDVPLAKLIEDRLQRPVFVTNDANAAALGEAKIRRGPDVSG